MVERRGRGEAVSVLFAGDPPRELCAAELREEGVEVTMMEVVVGVVLSVANSTVIMTMTIATTTVGLHGGAMAF